MAGARLVVFPECALSGYGFSSREEGLAHAVSLDSGPVRKVVAACERHQCFCVFGLLERDGDRLVSTPACSPVPAVSSAAIARFICRSWGSTCSSIPATGRSRSTTRAGLKVGMHICYDGGFPETARVLTLLGADLLVLPTNWPTHSECAAEHMIPTRAMENTVYVMAVNRVGEESGFRFIGRSSIVDPERARACAGRAGFRRGPPGRHRPRDSRGGSTWCASRAGTRSTGSPIAGRGFTRLWSRPTGVTDRSECGRLGDLCPVDDG